MRKVYVNENMTVEIGCNGENNATALCFPVIEKWKLLYGNEGTYTIKLRKPKGASSYSKETFTDEFNAYCILSAEDLAESGIGKAMVMYTDGTTVAKSVIYNVKISESL